MSVQDWDSTECTECGMYNVTDVVCGDCLKEALQKQYNKAIEDVLEVLPKYKFYIGHRDGKMKKNVYADENLKQLILKLKK